MKRAVTSIAGAAVLLGLARLYRADTAAARQRLERPSVLLHQVQTSAGTMQFVDLGQGVPVLVVHGNIGGWDQVVDWAGRRLDPGFRVIGPSRFGYPGSDLPPDATAARQADVLVELLDHLGLGSVAVVSLSAGSMTAVQLAARHPDRVRALVLESPVLPTEKPLKQPPAAVFNALTSSEPISWLTARSPALVAAASGAPWHRLSDAQRTELRQVLRTTTPAGPRAAGVFFDNVIAYQDIVHDRLPWEKVQAPTLVVAAHDSPLPSPSDTAAMLERLPNGRLFEVPTGGHLLLGNVARLRSELEAFLGDPG